MIQQTLIILKPDAVTRWITWKIIDRLESKWLKLIACKMKQLNEEILKTHYSHLVDKPFFPNIVRFITSAPVILQVWEWVDCVDVVRQMIWATNARKAIPGTVRWDFGNSISKNCIHASESYEASISEINRFFDKSEIYSYKRVDESWIYDTEDLD